MKKIYKWSLGFGILFIIYMGIGFIVSSNSHYMPTYYVDLTETLSKETLTQEDYELIYSQTGLAQPMIQRLETEDDFKTQILHFQDNYFKPRNVKRTDMNWLTNIDENHNEMGQTMKAFNLAPYENGYIFLTKSTYTANWRHGHAGLVVDAKRGKVLESLAPGTISGVWNASTWEYYPTFKMMRLKDASSEELDAISNYALENLQNLPYNILAMKNFNAPPKSTHCSLIVWQAFIPFGYDLDHNKGIFVSPGDLAASPLLETLQIFGFDPEKDW